MVFCFCFLNSHQRITRFCDVILLGSLKKESLQTQLKIFLKPQPLKPTNLSHLESFLSPKAVILCSHKQEWVLFMSSK